MARKKIILVCTAYRGGIQTIIKSYRATGLYERWPVRELNPHIDLHASSIAKLSVMFSCLMRYLWMLLSGQVALLHVHASSYNSFWRKSAFVLLTLAARKPVIVHLHSGEFINFYETSGRVRRAFVRFILQRATIVVVLSEQWKKRLEAIVCKANIVSIASPIALGPERPHRSERNGMTLLFLGELSRKKGVFDLLEAVADLADEFPKLALHVAGSGDRSGVVVAAQRLNIDARTVVDGWIEGEQKQIALETATALVLPSLGEGVPISVLEAMAVGTPIVATSVGGIPDVIINNVNGLLFQPGDVEGLKKKIRLLLSDPELQKKLALSGRAFVEINHHDAKVVEKVEALYRSLGAEPKVELGRS